jgi:hypothetical protein
VDVFAEIRVHISPVVAFLHRKDMSVYFSNHGETGLKADLHMRVPNNDEAGTRSGCD